MKQLSHRVISGIFVPCALSLFACAPNTGAGKDDGKGSPQSAGGAHGAGSAGGGTGVTVPADDGGMLIDLGSNGDLHRDASGEDAKCGELVLEPEAIQVEKQVEINCSADSPEPLAIYIVLDNSGSMQDNNKWTDAVSALTSFVQSDPTAKGSAWTCTNGDGGVVPAPASLPPPGTGAISVGIQYFHPQNAGSNPNECDGSAHATPAVAVGPIPANGAAIVSSLGQTGPNGNTPTTGSLMGGTQFCTAYQAANPGKKCVVVLMTDGEPNGCNLSSTCPTGGNDCVDPASASTLTPIAAQAHASGVLTFTIGMSGVNADGFALLDAIAVAGGSDCTPGSPGNETCNVTTGGAQGFLDALNTIRSTVQVSSTASQTVTTTQTSTLPCQWSIPKPTNGKTFDQNRVNVSVTASGTTDRVGNVATATDCTAAGGWYYDDNAAPTRIQVCDSTCSSIQASPDTKVEVLVGCSTVRVPAR